MRRALVLVVVLAACSSGGKAATSTSSASSDVSAFCAVMSRTDVDMRSGDLGKAALAMSQRQIASPDELRQAWPVVSTEAAKHQIQDWTYTHCGFTPTMP